MSSHDNPTTLDALVIRLVATGGVPKSSPHPCSYIEGETAVEEGFLVEQLRPMTYHRLMDLGFRRSGKIFYRPRCPSCAKCVQIRVPTDRFERSKSQRRVWRKNDDLTLSTDSPTLTDEKAELYGRYLRAQHPDSKQGDGADSLAEFLYTSAVDTIEACYRDRDGKLVGVSILDNSPASLSSVYHFFDPEEAKRSIGVYSVMREIELAATWGVPYYYLGFWVEGAATMQYKAKYYPHQLLIDGRWQEVERP